MQRVYTNRFALFALLMAVLGSALILSCLRSMSRREDGWDRQSSAIALGANLAGIAIGALVALWGISYIVQRFITRY